MTQDAHSSETLFAGEPGKAGQRRDLAALPLAARMRPLALEEFVGQDKIVGPGTWLREAIEADRLSSIILWGPPGSGKSTLARIIAEGTQHEFQQFSAVTSGVADVRRVVAEARRKCAQGRRTILFVDEIHRFNKAQQDAFLPHVEDGTIILVGATTENPYFEINRPLISRSRILVLEALSREDLEIILERALQDPVRGLGRLKIDIDGEARDHMIDAASGDARAVLTSLELAAQLAPEDEGRLKITKEIAEKATQERILAYDKGADEHYDTISAFIKSMRGSDPDAAVYWLAKMLSAGEDPRFIARRMVIQAAEDVGNADPMALLVANAAAHAVEYVGLPECQIPLAQAAIYISCAPKSNAAYLAIAKATQDIRDGKDLMVPPHLRTSPGPGSGKGYKYPHDYPGGTVRQEYLPPALRGTKYYKPTDRGRERKLSEWLAGARGEGDIEAG
jgi:putative ATPase